MSYKRTLLFIVIHTTAMRLMSVSPENAHGFHGRLLFQFRKFQVICHLNAPVAANTRSRAWNSGRSQNGRHPVTQRFYWQSKHIDRLEDH